MHTVTRQFHFTCSLVMERGTSVLVGVPHCTLFTRHTSLQYKHNTHTSAQHTGTNTAHTSAHTQYPQTAHPSAQTQQSAQRKAHLTRTHKLAKRPTHARATGTTRVRACAHTHTHMLCVVTRLLFPGPLLNHRKGSSINCSTINPFTCVCKS